MNSVPIFLQTMIGLTGISLLISVILLRILFLLKLKKQSSYLLSFLFFTLSFISLSGDSINFYIRGLINDLSITTLFLLASYVIQPRSNTSQTLPIYIAIVITGLFFYPAALGLGPIDPYSWGFINNGHELFAAIIFIILLITLMIFAMLKAYSFLLSSLVFSVAAYQVGLLESRNLWDYLLDPLIFIYALFVLFSHLSSLLINKTSTELPINKNK